MKLMPSLMLLALVMMSCQNAKEDATSDLEALLTSVKAEMETYQAGLTSINETHKALLSKTLEGMRVGQINAELAEIVAPHKKVALSYEEALKNYLNLIPQLEEVISRSTIDSISAASLKGSYDQVLGQKDQIIEEMETLKSEHEQYRDILDKNK